MFNNYFIMEKAERKQETGFASGTTVSPDNTEDTLYNLKDQLLIELLKKNINAISNLSNEREMGPVVQTAKFSAPAFIPGERIQDRKSVV